MVTESYAIIQLQAPYKCCTGLSAADENRIEGIYLSVTVDSDRARTEPPGCPFVHSLPNSRLDHYDFSVSHVVNNISPKISTEIVVHLLAQR